MRKLFFLNTSLFALAVNTFLFADCCIQCFDVGIGWRHDDLQWKVKDLESSYISAEVDDHIHFKEINSYDLHASAKWAGSDYYIRASADYGWTNNGRAVEFFNIDSSYLSWSDLSVKTSSPIKRRSEMYDFNIAFGYPFTLCCNQLNIIPLIGFSYHRQHIRVKGTYPFDFSETSSSFFSNPYSLLSDSDFLSDSFSSSFLSNSSSYFSSNPFASESDPNIANKLGLLIPKRSSTYRMTWYGPFVGADIAYALDADWTLFTELEGHFLDNCHRKRKSCTGVYFLDEYHHKGWAYGFDATVGTTLSLTCTWYTTLQANYKWWKAHSKDDELHWKSVDVNLSIGAIF